MKSQEKMKLEAKLARYKNALTYRSYLNSCKQKALGHRWKMLGMSVMVRWAEVMKQFCVSVDAIFH